MPKGNRQLVRPWRLSQTVPDGISVHRRKAEKENDGHSDEFRREHWEGGVGLGTFSDPGVGTRVVAPKN